MRNAGREDNINIYLTQTGAENMVQDLVLVVLKVHVLQTVT